MRILDQESIMELVRLGTLKAVDESGNVVKPDPCDDVQYFNISNKKAKISTYDKYTEKGKTFIVPLDNIRNEDVLSLTSIKTLNSISNINKIISNIDKMIRFLYVIGIINVVCIALWIILSIIGASSSPRY